MQRVRQNPVPEVMDTKSIIRVQKNKDNPYVMIDKRIFGACGLSWKAKGLLGYLLSRPDNWKIIVADLVKQSTDGRDSVYSGLKELVQAGYIIRERKRIDKGRYAAIEYIVLEEPHEINDSTTYGFSVSGLSVSGKAVSGKSDTNNTDVTKKDLTKKDCKGQEKKSSKRERETKAEKYEKFYL